MWTDFAIFGVERRDAESGDAGAYWTGIVYPAAELFPGGEHTSYTAAAVILAGQMTTLDPTDDCTNTCTVAACGDGALDESSGSTEQCDTAGNSTSSAPLTVTTEPTFLVRVNAGGSNYTDSLGHLWQSDRGFNTGLKFTTGDLAKFANGAVTVSLAGGEPRTVGDALHAFDEIVVAQGEGHAGVARRVEGFAGDDGDPDPRGTRQARQGDAGVLALMSQLLGDGPAKLDLAPIDEIRAMAGRVLPFLRRAPRPPPGPASAAPLDLA